jgi:bifunctional non-homologous end joining protein LigD
VQRHRATRLHYDFRLEIDGVLVSWAVPKGPTLDSTQRRMASPRRGPPDRVLRLRGRDPGQAVRRRRRDRLDWGTWEAEAPTLDGRKAVEDGELKFELRGEKLHGRFTIVRTGGRRGADSGRPFQDDSEQWLLIHKRGPDTIPGWDAEQFPASVKTGRTNDEVKANKDAIWISQAPPARPRST